MRMKRYQALARAYRWLEDVNAAYRDEAESRVEWLMESAPSGGGIAGGTRFDDITVFKGVVSRLKFRLDYHHAGPDESRPGWTNHRVIVIPALDGEFSMWITGSDRNHIKDYLAHVYSGWLSEEVDYYPPA